MAMMWSTRGNVSNIPRLPWILRCCLLVLVVGPVEGLPDQFVKVMGRVLALPSAVLIDHKPAHRIAPRSQSKLLFLHRPDVLRIVNGGAKLVHPGGAKLVHLTLCGTRCWGVVPVVHRRDPRCFE